MERMRQNFDIFDFELDQADMAAIAALDLGESSFYNHESIPQIERMGELYYRGE